MDIFELERQNQIEMRPFLTTKHMQTWNNIVEVASKVFVEELNSIDDDRELAIILGFAAKICEKIDSFQTVNSLTVPRATNWFTVIWCWLKRKKTN